MSKKIRVAGALVGSVHQQLDMSIKYGRLFDALGSEFDLSEIYDARLRGIRRYWNALQTFSPSVSCWRERFFKNTSAFEMRSQAAQKHFRGKRGSLDVVLQLGALFAATGQHGDLPVVLYTDNTTLITAQQPATNRFPFSQAELKHWLEHEKRLYQSAAHICTRASVVKRSLVEEYHVAAERISVIGGGVNFALDAQGRQPPRQPGAPFTVLFIGSDFHRKGGDLLLQAFSLVRRLYPNTLLILVTRDGIPAGLPMEGVKVMALTWDRHILEAVYRQADVFVLPSRHETWGDVLLEAMSFGLPCIGVLGQAMEEIIVEGETGLLVHSGQVEALAHAIIHILEQPELRRRMGTAARRLVVKEFTWERVVERLTPVLRAVTSQLPVSTRTSLLERMSA